MWFLNKMSAEIILLFSPEDLLSLPYIGKWRHYWASLPTGKFNLVTPLSKFPLSISKIKMKWSVGSRHKEQTSFDHSLCYCKQAQSSYWCMPKRTSLPDISACVADVLIPEELDLFRIAMETRGWCFFHQIHLATVWMSVYSIYPWLPWGLLRTWTSLPLFSKISVVNKHLDGFVSLPTITEEGAWEVFMLLLPV